jgi:hypothetical protein
MGHILFPYLNIKTAGPILYRNPPPQFNSTLRHINCNKALVGRVKPARFSLNRYINGGFHPSPNNLSKNSKICVFGRSGFSRESPAHKNIRG